MKMRMGMLRPMNSNDMTKLSLGRPILAAGASAPNRANAPCTERRLRYPTSAAIANPTGTSNSGISQRPSMSSSLFHISPAGSVSSASSPSLR